MSIGDGPWTAGSPCLGLAVGGIGLTRHAVSGALFGAPFAGLGALLALIYLLRGDPTAAIPGGGYVVTPTGIGAVMFVCGAMILLGLVVSVVTLSTLRQHGRALTTRRYTDPRRP